MSEIPVPDTEEATGVFVEHRELLFGVVYNMLGSVTDTEDVLQDTWLSWSRRGPAGSTTHVPIWSGSPSTTLSSGGPWSTAAARRMSARGCPSPW